MNDRTAQLTESFQQHKEHAENTAFKTAGEYMSVEDKLKILEDRGQTDLIEIFKDWKPRTSARKRTGAPLDQRISITITPADKAIMEGEIRAVKATGSTTSLGNIIRSRAMGNLNVQDWVPIADEALRELDEIDSQQNELRKHRKAIEADLENSSDDNEQVALYERELYDIDQKLAKLKAKPEKRSVRLQGRITYQEAESIKWRAYRLGLSTTDYLRIMVFDLKPNGSADSHLSLDARRRFWISILDVAKNSWGNPPGVFQCSQCESYSEEITRLRERIRQLEG